MEKKNSKLRKRWKKGFEVEKNKRKREKDEWW